MVYEPTIIALIMTAVIQAIDCDRSRPRHPSFIGADLRLSLGADAAESQTLTLKN